MKSYNQIIEKRLELSRKLSDLMFENKLESQETNVILEQITILDWILEINN